jgi:hypothetical protein
MIRLSGDERTLLEAIATNLAATASIALLPKTDERSLLASSVHAAVALAGASLSDARLLQDERSLLVELEYFLRLAAGGSGRRLAGDERDLLQALLPHVVSLAGGDLSDSLLLGDERELLSEIAYWTGQSPAGPEIYLLDTFHDVNGTLLQNHIADTGQAWLAGFQANLLSIDSNKMHGASGGAANCFIEAGHSDYELHAHWEVINLAANCSDGFMVRAGVGSTDYPTTVYFLMSWPAVGASLTAFYFIGGVFTSSLVFSKPSDGVIDVVLRVSGTQFTMAVNGVAAAPFSSSYHQTATLVGVRPFGGNANWTIFQVTAL